MQDVLRNGLVIRGQIQCFEAKMKTLRFPITAEMTAAVPAKLQLDGWWLDSEIRPFPKQITPVKVAATNVKSGVQV